MEFLKVQTPDFIFLDINMPKVNGIECLIKLKSDSRLKRIPVIIYSTTSDENEVRKIMMLGAHDFISKAISFDELKKHFIRSSIEDIRLLIRTKIVSFRIDFKLATFLLISFSIAFCPHF